MKTGKLHINEHKPTEAELVIEGLLATIYAMRVSLKLNHTEAEIKAYDYLKGLK
jgi:hypothetical protein